MSMRHEIAGVEVAVDGDGPDTLVFVHGWPDTMDVWDRQLPALAPRHRCVRLTLPGFDVARPAGRAFSLDEVVAAIGAVVDALSPQAPVTLVLHDWGCLFGYQYAMRHAPRVARVVGVDIGDAGSRAHLRELGLRGQLMTLAYQWWLAVAWRVGGGVGDWMARRMASLLRAPAPPARIGAQQGYPYAVRWLGVAGGFGGLRRFEPACPMLYLYGERKPLMFHSRAWVAALQSRPGCRAVGLPAGHWLMRTRTEAFNAAVVAWLDETVAAPR